MMSYIKVKWLHSNEDYPVWLYSELDAERWEKRKVEIYKDGQSNYADKTISTGSTCLGEASIPLLAKIATDTQFEPIEITKEEFEEVWKKCQN